MHCSLRIIKLKLLDWGRYDLEISLENATSTQSVYLAEGLHELGEFQELPTFEFQLPEDPPARLGLHIRLLDKNVAEPEVYAEVYSTVLLSGAGQSHEHSPDDLMGKLHKAISLSQSSFQVILTYSIKGTAIYKYKGRVWFEVIKPLPLPATNDMVEEIQPMTEYTETPDSNDRVSPIDRPLNRTSLAHTDQPNPSSSGSSSREEHLPHRVVGQPPATGSEEEQPLVEDSSQQVTDTAFQGAQGLQHSPQGLQHSPQGLQHSPQGLQHSPQGLQHSPQGLQHSPQGLQHSPQGLQHSPQGLQHSPQGLLPSVGAMMDSLIGTSQSTSHNISHGSHVTDVLATELKGCREAMKKMADDIVHLREENRQIVKENGMLKRLTIPEITSVDGASGGAGSLERFQSMGRADLVLKAIELDVLCGNLRQQLDLYKEKVVVLQNELIAHQDVDLQLVQLKEAHTKQQELVQDTLHKLEKYKKYKETCRVQEEVIAGLESLVCKEVGQMQGIDTAKAHTLLKEENATLRAKIRRLESASPCSMATGKASPQDDRIACLIKQCSILEDNLRKLSAPVSSDSHSVNLEQKLYKTELELSIVKEQLMLSAQSWAKEKVLYQQEVARKSQM